MVSYNRTLGISVLCASLIVCFEGRLTFQLEFELSYDKRV